MYKFFFHISWRNFTKQGVFPVINIAGLSIGLTVVLLICLLIYNEQSFDKSFKEGKNIYRINAPIQKYMPGETAATVGNIVGPSVQREIPAVEAFVRLYPAWSLCKVDDQLFNVEMHMADKDFFRLFDTPFLYGDAGSALARPNTVALSEKTALRLFGNRNPVGEFVSIENASVEVIAVYRDFPKNSSFDNFQAMVPWTSDMDKDLRWGGIDFETFVLLDKQADPKQIEVQMNQLMDNAHKGREDQKFYTLQLQGLEKIHLYSAKFFKTYTSHRSDIARVKMLTLLAFIVLLIACINYMNLSTARAQKRSKEIGVSKTLGAKRSGLVLRLLCETSMLTLVAFVVAFIMAYLLLPLFNQLLGEQLLFGLFFDPLFLLSALVIWFLTSIIAASYPAIYLSGFPPLMAIRQTASSGKPRHAMVRKALTIGQFVAAMILIVWVVTIQSQIKYMNSKDIGFNPHHLIGIPAYMGNESSIQTLESDYRAQSSVEMIARESTNLFNGNGNVLYNGPDDKDGVSFTTIAIDPNFINLMQMRLIAGATVPERHPDDSIIHIVINRKAVEYLEMTPEEVVGKKIYAQIGSPYVYVSGVVENFNFESLHKPVEAFGMHNGKNRKNVLMLRVKEGDLSGQLNLYEQIYKKHFPNSLFEPIFPDVEMEQAYDGERRTNRVATVFSVLAILVACMGVFGLTAFMAEQRIKEIGIRKVMGASVGNVVRLFTNSYVKLLLVSLVIAVPIAWWVSDHYLQDFAYRISLGWWMFAIAAIITIVLTLFTVSIHAIKAAMANPVKSLKTE